MESNDDTENEITERIPRPTSALAQHSVWGAVRWGLKWGLGESPRKGEQISTYSPKVSVLSERVKLVTIFRAKH